jgi:23S rRNA (uracil1939-C5)-methyltransferase
LHPIKVTIHDLSRAGSGVAKTEDGMAIFVPFSAPGDELLVNIVKAQKNYSHAEIVEIITPSPLRVKPPCAVFGKCGGCAWQHLPYSLQFETKKKGLLHTLKRAGHNVESIPLDEFPAKNAYSYRNRVQLRGNPTAKKFGYYERASNEITSILRCEIAREEINEVLPEISQEGFKKFPMEFKAEIDLSAEGEVRVAWNERHAAFGFRQVNDEQNEVLQQWILKHVGKGEVLLDLFGGYGNLSLKAAHFFGEVHCVDTLIPNYLAEDDLPSNFRYHKRDALTWLRNQTIAQGRARRENPKRQVSAIIDPPREGLGNSFAEFEDLLSTTYRPQKILFVGCDVDSFAKDTANFVRQGYKLERLGVLDLFPQTPHLESLALLSL